MEDSLVKLKQDNPFIESSEQAVVDMKGTFRLYFYYQNYFIFPVKLKN